MALRRIDWDRFAELWREGLSIRELANEFDVPMRWVCRLRKRMELPTRSPWRGGNVGVRNARLKQQAGLVRR